MLPGWSPSEVGRGVRFAPLCCPLRDPDRCSRRWLDRRCLRQGEGPARRVFWEALRAGTLPSFACSGLGPCDHLADTAAVVHLFGSASRPPGTACAGPVAHIQTRGQIVLTARSFDLRRLELLTGTLVGVKQTGRDLPHRGHPLFCLGAVHDDAPVHRVEHRLHGLFVAHVAPQSVVAGSPCRQVLAV